MTPEEARIKYAEMHGQVTDEEWAEISADVEDWDAFFAGEAGAPDPVAEAVAAAIAQTKEEMKGVVQAAIADVQTAYDAKLDDLRAQLQSQSEDAKVRDAATAIRASFAGFGDGSEKVAESSIAVFAALSADPGPDTINAVLEHLKLNGGKLCTIPVGQINATMDEATPGSMEGKLVALGQTDKPTETAIRDLAARESIGLDAAWSKHFRSLSGL